MFILVINLPCILIVAKEEEPKEETAGETEAKPEEPVAEADTKPPPPPEPEVDASHPEVVAMVEAAVAEAEKQTVTLPAEAIVEVMEAAIAEVEKNMRNEHPEGPLWVFFFLFFECCSVPCSGDGSICTIV